MIKLKPPQHRVDGVAVYIAQGDTAWDLDAILAEREACIAAAVKAKAPDLITDAERAAAVARSPVERYYSGKTRFQPGAADWMADGKPGCARDFLKPGERPAEFGLRRLGYRAYCAVSAGENIRARLIESARLGLCSITADGYTWQAIGDALAGDNQLEALHEANPSLLHEIGAAVLNLSRPLDDEAELPR